MKPVNIALVHSRRFFGRRAIVILTLGRCSFASFTYIGADQSHLTPAVLSHSL